MLIVNLTTSDPAGSIIRQAQAINRYTEHTARVICSRDLGFGWDKDIIVGEPFAPNVLVEHLISEADLIVMHKPVELQSVAMPDGKNVLEWILGRGKKFAIYHHGEGSIRTEPEKVAEFQKNIQGPRIVVTPDLLEKSPGATFIPNTIDAHDMRYIPAPKLNTGTPEVSQCNTFNWEKDTDWIMGQIKQGQIPAHKFKMISGMTWPQCLEEKKRSDIGIDHLQGYWGLSGLEYAAMGVPCLCGVDAFNAAHIRIFFEADAIPFVQVDRDTFAPALRNLINNRELREDLGALHRQFMLHIWTGEYIAKKITDLYQGWVENER